MPDRRLPSLPHLLGPRAALGPARVVAVLVTLLLVALSACGGPDVPEPTRRPPGPGELPPEETFLAEVDQSRGFRDCFPVIRDPELIAADGPHGIAADEQVLGLDLGVAQVAYPVNLLNHHENVEHTLAGYDLLVCW